MTKSAHLANTLLTKLTSETFGQLKMIHKTPDNLNVDKNGMQSTVYVDRMTFNPFNARQNEGADQQSNIPDTEQHWQKTEQTMTWYG